MTDPGLLEEIAELDARMDDPDWGALLQWQQALEEQGLEQGINRFRKSVDKALEREDGATVGGAKGLVQWGLGPMVKGLEDMLAAKRKGRRPAIVEWVSKIGPEKAAYITLKAAFDGWDAPRSLVALAMRISAMILDQLRYERFQKEAPGLFQYRMARFTTNSYVHRKRSLDATLKYADIDVSDLELISSRRVVLGTQLLDVMIETTGLASKKTVTVRRVGRGMYFKQEIQIAPTETAREWIVKRNHALEVMTPVRLPMVVPPLPWSKEAKGGYRFTLLGNDDFIRVKPWEPSVDLTEARMPYVYEGVNRVQETAWRVNRRVLDVIEELYDRGVEIKGMPSREPLDEPARPANIDTDKEARRDWRRRTAKVKDANAERLRDVLKVRRTLAAAATVKAAERIWFPYTCDFRGRIYPAVTYLNPQGEDIERALLTFAGGKPLGEEGAAWLAIHGANMLETTAGGERLNKASLQRRANWIQEHSNEICAVAEDPLSHRWWMEAKKPFQFLAFCFAWAGFVQAFRAGAGDAFVCSLPVAQDGTCNGLQHYSAMLRDEVGGLAVNLVPGDTPQDVYADLAHAALGILEDEAGGAGVDDGNAPRARLWLQSGLVTRDLSKRPTMTFTYGSKSFGFRDQIEQDLRKLFREDPTLETAWFMDGEGESTLFDMTVYLSGVLWRALAVTVKAAAEAMEWLRLSARIVVKAGKALAWTVPVTGFPVTQPYYKTELYQVDTYLAGKLTRPSLRRDTDDLSLHQQVNGMAPNFIHSMDAAALMMTVVLAHSVGIHSFGMIHDSYATVPGDAALLAQCTREAFIALYHGREVLESLASQLEELSGVKIPPRPLAGTLDVTLVRESDYFFA